MTRLVLAIVAAAALSGCRQSGQQAIDPFWGRTTVPPCPTGQIGAPIVNPGYQQPLTPQVTITPGTPTTLPGGTLSPGAPPNLLPAPTSSAPAGTISPTPTMPGAANGGGYGAPAVTSPPSAYPMPNRAPLSGYYNSDSTPLGAPPGSPAVTMPGSGSSGAYPATPTTPNGMAPATNGTAPAGTIPGSSSPTGPAPNPAPAGSPSSGGVPGYFPPGGFNYDNRNGSTRPSPGGNWTTPNGVAVTPTSLDGAVVSAPPEKAIRPAAADVPDLGTGPSVIRIPSDGGSAPSPAP